MGTHGVVSAKLISGLSSAHVGEDNMRPTSGWFQMTRAMSLNGWVSGEAGRREETSLGTLVHKT